MALLVGCGQATPAPGRGASETTAARAQAPKVVTIGILREPNTFHNDLTQGTGAQGGNTQVLYIPHNYLVVENDRGLFQPQLAA